MQCGPVRYRVDAKSQAATRPFSHKVTIRETGFRLAPDLESQSPTQISAIYAALGRDEKRNDRIFDDVLMSLEAGRRPVVLTERRDHLDHLRGRFQHFTKNLVVLYGGMTTVERREAEERLKTPHTEERLVLATGSYLGEGFDDASLDTLFLTMPISWRGTLAQYVGRLHREHHAKHESLSTATSTQACRSSAVWRSSARLGIAASVTKFRQKSQLRWQLRERPYRLLRCCQDLRSRRHIPNPEPPLTMPPGAAGPAREFQVTVVCLPISIEAVSDFTAAGDRQRMTG
jgi:superfamily II DNA or RNA helicase